MILLPSYYQRSSRAYFTKWPKVKFCHRRLITSGIFPSIYIPKVGNVYSVVFGDNSKGLGFSALWNAVDGWLVTFLDAEINKAVLQVKLDFYKNNKVIQNNGECY